MTGAALNTVNTDWTTSNWVFTDNLYPRLLNMDTTDAAYLSASPAFLATGDTVDAVKQGFTMSTANGIVWASGDSSVVRVSGGSADLLKTGSVRLTASLGNISKSVMLTIPASASFYGTLGMPAISASAGNTPGSTIITVGNKANNADTLQYVVSHSSISTPDFGSTVSETVFSSGDTITGVSSDDYVGVYELDANSKIVGFSQKQLTADEIGATPVLTTPSIAAAAGNSGNTVVTAGDLADSGDTLQYVLSSTSISSPAYGDAITGITGAQAFNSGTTQIPATAGQYIGVYEVDSNGKIVGFTKTQLTTDQIGATSGSGSGSSPSDVTINGGNSGSTGSGTDTSVKIPAADTNTSTVNHVIINLPDVSVTAPSSVMNSAIGSDASNWLVLSQDPTAAQTQIGINKTAASIQVTPLTTLDVNLTRYYSNGTSEAVHQLSDYVTVTIKLTAAQIAAIKSSKSAQLFYYDPSTGGLVNMNAVFDLSAGTSTFRSNHFSTFIVAIILKLPDIKSLGWDSSVPGKVTWSAVSKASGYKVQLLKDDSAVDTETVSAHSSSYDFTSIIQSNGPGNYTFAITAIGDGVNYSNSDTQTSGETYHYTGKVAENIGISYRAHVRNNGWLPYLSNGAQAGTTGQSLRMEAVQIHLTVEVPDGASVIYQVHVRDIGWLAPVKDDTVAGTAGQKRRMEAIRITLKGLAGYAVEYRVHVKNYGWLSWQTTKNGTDISKAAVAGTTGQCRRAEAIEVRIVKVQ